jgi:hypothetical protein
MEASRWYKAESVRIALFFLSSEANPAVHQTQEEHPARHRFDYKTRMPRVRIGPREYILKG